MRDTPGGNKGRVENGPLFAILSDNNRSGIAGTERLMEVIVWFSGPSSVGLADDFGFGVNEK